jgi:polysaccharide export outer membrane protein
MRHYVLAVRVAIIGVALVALSGAPACAQRTEAELLELLEILSPEEREELLETYGLPTVPGADSLEVDAGAPETVLPRDVEAGGISLLRPLARVPDTEIVPEQPEPTPGSQAEEIPGAQRAFTGYVDDLRPSDVGTGLDQFGYDLFAGAPTTFAPATDIPVSSDYVIGPGDELRVQFYGKTNVSVDLVVDRDGTVPLPELGPISVAGLTFSEMKEFVTREVDRRLIGLTVNVSMGRLRSIRVFVLGDVYRPGSYTVSSLSTLTNALFASGGVRQIGSLRRIMLKRDGATISEMDLYDLLIKGDTSDDARLQPGDVIFVPTIGSVAGVAGEVLRPAIYEVNGPMSLRELIELAGGLKPSADREVVQLERIENGRIVVYDVPLADSDDWAVESGDLLTVYPIARTDEHALFVVGNVLRPGRRAFFDGMRLLDLIPSIYVLRPETHFDYGIIEREGETNRETEYVAFDLAAALLDSIPEANIPLRPRDRVYVFHRSHFRELPVVAVRGEVRSPGSYEHKKGMRIVDLVLAAGGLTRDAWLDSAELLRTGSPGVEVSRYSIDLGEALSGGVGDNVILQDMDELVVHSSREFADRDTVHVLGEVNNPGSYPLSTGMRVSDLIFAGGNLRESAYIAEAELTRYEIIDGERRELHHVSIDLDGALDGLPEADLELEPNDRLLVRRLTNWRSDEVVAVSGEVAFPGSYPIEEGERLSDLIERFGGFLADAYLEAAVFKREAVRELQAEQLDRMSRKLEADLARLAIPNARGTSGTEEAQRQAALEAGEQLSAELSNTEATGRVVIRLAEAGAIRDTEDDIVLSDGDRLHVPKKPDFVMVMGQVNNSTAFHFEQGRRAAHYIELAGGKTRFADMGGTYVVRADGSVEKGRGLRVCPGDVVVVPETLERFAGMQFLLDISQVLYQLGLAAASAHVVGAN